MEGLAKLLAPSRHQEAMLTLCVTWLRTNISVKIKIRHIRNWAQSGSGLEVVSTDEQEKSKARCLDLS